MKKLEIDPISFDDCATFTDNSSFFFPSEPEEPYLTKRKKEKFSVLNDPKHVKIELP